MLLNATGWGMWYDGYLYQNNLTGQAQFSYPDNYITFSRDKLGIDISNGRQQDIDTILSLVWRFIHIKQYGRTAMDGSYMEFPGYAEKCGIHIVTGWAEKYADTITVGNEEVIGDILNDCSFSAGYVIAYQMDEGKGIIITINKNLYDSFPSYIKNMETASII